MATYLGEYLPKVLTRVQYMQDDISENPCEACGNWAEMHKWVIVAHTGQRVIYCSECDPIHPIQPVSTTIGGNAGKVYV